ncbi:MAG: hypothetical protein Q9160_003741 [Pyrenula sp. 1 TL-2023]
MEYYNAFEHTHGLTWTGTGEWLMHDRTFETWLDTLEANGKLLWLQGTPGAALSVLRSLMFQLASQADTLQEVLCQSSLENLKGSTDCAVELLTAFLALVGPVYIVVDGLDEIDEVHRCKLLKQLLGLLEKCENMKLLISSRPDADITAILQEKSADIRVDHRNCESIEVFVTQSLRRWFAERDFLPEGRAEIERLLAPLTGKSKGMFLYAEVVLTNIQDLEVHEIHRELQVLPESLDDAYGRVLARVNALRPPALKNKARKLLGWIGCSPTPLTIQEMEQALLIDFDDTEGSLTVLSRLNIIKICGSIVEVVDDYVQFVHFTVKEYLFSPKISGSIDGPEATLNLAMCCIAYLCQRHHDPQVGDEEINAHAISGAYRFHNFSTNMWLELLDRTAALLPRRLPDALIDLLSRLSSQRCNQRCNSEAKAPSSVHLQEYPEIDQMLSKADQFRRAYSESDYNTIQNTFWVDLDPLTISSTSIRIQRRLEQLLCATIDHDENCHCDVIYRHYGITKAVAFEEPDDDDEIEPLLIDLISADKVESVRGLLLQFKKLGPARDTKLDPNAVSALAEVLRSDSDDLFEDWLNNVDLETKSTTDQMPLGAHFIRSPIIQATEGQLHREDYLLQVWKKLDLLNSCGSIYVGDALFNVASTTCSIKLAEYLLDHGAEVDHRRSKRYMTPLQHAARKTTCKAANLMKLLLLKGADPEMISENIYVAKKTRIRDEKGAKEISKWLGMSWDELLADVKAERQKEQETNLKEAHPPEG